jgi:hypothetical protein
MNDWLDDLDIISLDYEFKETETQKKIKTGELDPEVRKTMQRRASNRRYHQKNKDRLNVRRRERAATIRGTFLAARHRARSKDEGWELSFEEWENVWESAPDVWDEQAKLYRRPFAMRGRSPSKCTQICRKDTNKPWHVDNVEIRYKLQAVPEDGVVGDWDLEKARPKPIELNEVIFDEQE